MQQISENEIIASVKAGNAADYSLLVKRYQDKAYSLLRRMLRDEASARDALQESFIKAYRLIGSFRGDSSFATWFYKIAYTTGLNFIKKDKQALERFSEIDEASYSHSESTPERQFEAGEKSELLKKLIERLPVKTALAVTLFYTNDCGITETAKIMQTSEANVKVLLHRGRAALKEMIEKEQLKQELL